jgi:WD40 repeat protein
MNCFIGNSNKINMFSNGSCLQTGVINCPGSIDTVTWSPDGNCVAIGCGQYVQIWEVNTRTKRVEIRLNGLARSVVWSPDGTKIASGSTNDVFRIWNSSTGVQLLELNHARCLRSIDWSPDGARIAVVLHDTIRIWDGETGVEQQEIGRASCRERVFVHV